MSRSICPDVAVVLNRRRARPALHDTTGRTKFNLADMWRRRRRAQDSSGHGNSVSKRRLGQRPGVSLNVALKLRIFLERTHSSFCAHQLRNRERG